MNNSIFIFLCKGVPADAKLVYDITLKSFERAKEGWQLDGEQKLEQSRCVYICERTHLGSLVG